MDTPPFSSSKLLFLILLFLLIFLPTLPVAASPAGNPSKMEVSKLKIITSVQCKYETRFRVLSEELRLLQGKQVQNLHIDFAKFYYLMSQ